MQPEHFMLAPKDWIPNNKRFPVLIYRRVLSGGDLATEFEKTFSDNEWGGIWHNGVFDYHHYHSGAHEVLGIAAGSARLTIGGPEGTTIEVGCGDCLVLPAGTGHRNDGSSDDFHLVGAHPPHQRADIVRSTPTEAQQARIDALPVPGTDPITGRSAGLLAIWSDQ